tara:strand:- start:416 stop:1321 length:906 start_codon:yes stop_codon:yes gene_type:complete
MSTAIGCGISTGVFGGDVSSAASILPSWNCDGVGNCSDPGDGTGTYSSLKACSTACPAPGFTFTVDTSITGASSSSQFALGMTAGGIYNFVVDWGDGTTDTITAYNQPEILHTYASSGVYTIVCRGQLARWTWQGGSYVLDRLKIIDVSYWGGTNLNINSPWAFFGAINMAVSATDSPANTGTLFTCFYSLGASSPFVTGIGAWDMSLVTDCAFMCLNASNFNEDISGWNVSNITDFNQAFAGTSMSTANYDALLIAWAPQTVNSFMFGIGSTKYTPGGAAEAARATLVSKGWTIIDGGPV